MTRPRRGFAIILVLVLLSIVSAVMAYATTATFAQRQSLHQRERRLQARWLLRSGFDRSLAKLQDKGATFEAEWKDLVPDSRIKVKATEAGKDQFRIAVEATAGFGKAEPVNVAETWTLTRRETGGKVRFEIANAKEK